jgi:alpha 1,2-mannosyltransferase
VPFTKEFKEGIRNLTDAKVEFGLIPKEHWSVPEWIDQERFKESLQQLDKAVSYGGLESYRHMCRFNSGFFYKHPMIQKYEYYWRIEPNVNYPCMLSYDPFLFMKVSGNKYGFNMIAAEEMRTVEGLWDTTKEFIAKKGIIDTPLLSLFGEKSFNGNHYW